MEIRLLRTEEAEEVFELIEKNRLYLRRWLPWVDDNRSVEDIKRYISNLLEWYQKKQAFHTVIRYDGRIAGMIGMQNVDWLNRKAVMGYWIGEEYQGLGLVTSACATLIDFAFRELDFNRLEMHCAVPNIKSRKIPERLGFKVEGLLRKAEWLYDHWVDHVLYALLHEDWRSYGSPSVASPKEEKP